MGAPLTITMSRGRRIDLSGPQYYQDLLTGIAMEILSELNELEKLDLAALGTMEIRRASHVEPDAVGAWWADLSPVGGPKLGPHTRRSAALEAELTWLQQNLLAAGRKEKLR